MKVLQIKLKIIWKLIEQYLSIQTKILDIIMKILKIIHKLIFHRHF